MVLPSNFSSKTNVQPRHATGVGVHARHVPVAHLSADMATIFIIILMISYIYIYIWVAATLNVLFLILIQTTGGES
jgi:hypothetical protein